MATNALLSFRLNNHYLIIVAVLQSLYLIKVLFPQKKTSEENLGSLDFTIFSMNYSIIVATRPEPTVRPPSRIAKVKPWSIAIG